jgi:hypothetical protein
MNSQDVSDFEGGGSISEIVDSDGENGGESTDTESDSCQSFVSAEEDLHL